MAVGRANWRYSVNTGPCQPLGIQMGGGEPGPDAELAYCERTLLNGGGYQTQHIDPLHAAIFGRLLPGICYF